jgi:hypothetical protein
MIQPIVVMTIFLRNLSAVFCLSLLFFSLPVQAKGSIGLDTFKIQHMGERFYMVNGQLTYELSDYLYESLRSGVTLRSETYIRLWKDRRLWWDASESLAIIRVSLSYHALSQHYQVIRDDTKEHWNFQSLHSALKKLGEIQGYKLKQLPESIDDGDHKITVSAVIKPESISFPLRVQSIFTNKYALKTSGVSWPLP